MRRAPAATPSRASVLKLAEVKAPPRARVPLSRSSVPVDDHDAPLREVMAMVPPAARRVPALFQLLPVNESVLPAVAATAVPAKEPLLPKLVVPDWEPERMMPAPMLRVLLACQVVMLLLALSAPANSMEPLPLMLSVVLPAVVLRRWVPKPVLARRMVAPSSVSVPRASRTPPLAMVTSALDVAAACLCRTTSVMMPPRTSRPDAPTIRSTLDSVPPDSMDCAPDRPSVPPAIVPPPLSASRLASSCVSMFSVPPETDSRPLITESSISVSTPPVTEMFSFENRLLTVKGLPVLRMVIVRSPGWSMMTSVLAVGIRPPAQLVAMSQKPDVCEIQVLAMAPVAKLIAFENVVALRPATPPVFSAAPLNTSSVPALTGKALAVSVPSSMRSVPLLVSGMASVTAAVPVLRMRPALSMRPLPACVMLEPPSTANSPDASTEMRPPS